MAHGRWLLGLQWRPAVFKNGPHPPRQLEALSTQADRGGVGDSDETVAPGPETEVRSATPDGDNGPALDNVPLGELERERTLEDERSGPHRARSTGSGVWVIGRGGESVSGVRWMMCCAALHCAALG